MYRLIIQICSIACSLLFIGVGTATGQNQLRNTTPQTETAIEDERLEEGDRSGGSTIQDNSPRESFRPRDPIFQPMSSAARSSVLSSEISSYELFEINA
ncbi:MAG: hypothetical protein AAFO91_04605, partial [Bacteroidota bacterium]